MDPTNLVVCKVIPCFCEYHYQFIRVAEYFIRVPRSFLLVHCLSHEVLPLPLPLPPLLMHLNISFIYSMTGCKINSYVIKWRVCTYPLNWQSCSFIRLTLMLPTQHTVINDSLSIIKLSS